MTHVTKETAVMLKEKGYNLTCRHYYHVKQDSPQPNNSCLNDYNTDPLLSDVYISAPNIYEATEWLRAKGVHVYAIADTINLQDIGWNAFIQPITKNKKGGSLCEGGWRIKFPTHDQALEDGIVNALKHYVK